MSEREVTVTALAAGGDGVARDDAGRVTFVPLTAPGDRVRVRLVHETKSFARAELLEILQPSPARVTPPCPHFLRGCGGCAWQHVTLEGQLAAKQAIVAGALRKLEGLTLHPIASPAPPLGWRRRARFHVAGGKVGLYRRASHEVLPIYQPEASRSLASATSAHCPQLEPALDAALHEIARATPPDGELALVLAHDGRILVATEKPWRGAARLVGRAGIVGISAAGEPHGEAHVEVEPGLHGSATEFAQASAAGNAALIERAREAIGRGPGTLVELHAGAGNLTRAFLADGWDVIASDVVAPAVPVARFERGRADEVLARLAGPVHSIVLDPPRAGAAEAIAGILRLAPRRIAYVSCDPATLARDVGHLAAAYRATDAWPIDLMPQTAHVEIVMRLESR